MNRKWLLWLAAVLWPAVGASGQSINGIPGYQITGIPNGSLTNSSVTLTAGCGIASLGTLSLGGSATIGETLGVNAQTSTSYTVQGNDCGKLVTFSNASAVAVTLPQATGSFAAGFAWYGQDIGVGTVTVTPTTSTINGASTLVIPQGQGFLIVSDGTNWQVFGALSASKINNAAVPVSASYLGTNSAGQLVSASLPVASGATQGTMKGDGSTITCTSGTCSASVGGNVSNSGTPSNGQIASWVNATTIQGVTGTGSGSPVLANSPTLITPNIGVATATTINKVTLTAPGTSATLTLANGKTFTVNNTITLAGTDGTTMTFPGTSQTLVGLGQANTYTSGLQNFGAVPFAPNFGSTNPGTCAIGQVFFNTASTAGQNWWFCTATNTWTQQLNSGGSGGSGTVNSSVAGYLAYYAANGTAVSGITTQNILSAANVLMYGVKGDCNTSTETAETTAINAVLASYVNVYFPPAPGGCYAINGRLLGKTGQTVIGSGVASKIEQFSTTADGIAFLASASGSRDIRLSAMYFQDEVRSTRTAGYGIDIDGTTDTAIFGLYDNFVYGFENGENLAASIKSFVIGDRSTSAINNAFNLVGATSGTDNSTSTSLYSTYADAPGQDCYVIGNVQYSTLNGTAADNCGRDGYHFYAESGGRPKGITLNSPGNETSARYGIYTEGQSFVINNPAISGIPTGSGNACFAYSYAMQISIHGGQCTGGDYVINVLNDPSFLPLNNQGMNRVEDIYYSGQGVGAYNDPNGYLNISQSRRNYAGTVPVTELHEVTTPTMLAGTLTVTGQLNNPYQVMTYKGGGEYTTNADETGTTLTFTLNACTSANCSSGRTILATWTTATVGAASNPYTNTWNTDAICQVQTTGSSGTLICHGSTRAATTSGGTVNTYNDASTSAVTLDLTQQYYVGMMVQKSSIKDTGITQDTNDVEFKLF